jgi:hypothetical protein
MVFALLLIIAVAISFFVSPLIAIVLFIVGGAAFLLMFGMRRASDESAGTSDPGSHAAARFRREGRERRVR